MSELAFKPAVDLASMIKTKQISANELLELYFERVDRFNDDLNAIIVQRREEAREVAAAADEAVANNDELGQLHGVPMTIKESYDIEGMPSTWGLPGLKDNIATRDSLSVARLKSAGAVIFGKTNVPLMLSDFQSYNEVYGTTNNPWNHALIPGGSSGGSAVCMASGMAGIETGSDIGGSIRNPAHFCGVYGHKPTYNMLPPRGHAMPGVVSPSDLSVIGPLARSATDLRVATEIMAGPDEIQAHGLKLDLQKHKKAISDLKIAIWRDDEMAPVDRSVIEKVDLVADCLHQLGAQVNPDARPDFTSEHQHRTYQALLQMTMMCRRPQEEYDDSVKRAETLDPDDDSFYALTLRSSVGRFRDWVLNNEERNRIRWKWHDFFKDYDAVIAPIMARAAFPHDHRDFGERSISVNGKQQGYFVQVFWAGLAINSYLPSTVFPAGLSSEGLPIGLQIIGPEYGDLVTIGIAEQLATEGFKFVPPPGYS